MHSVAVRYTVLLRFQSLQGSQGPVINKLPVQRSSAFVSVHTAAMAAVIPQQVHFEPGAEALRVSKELSQEPSLKAVALMNRSYSTSLRDFEMLVVQISGWPEFGRRPLRQAAESEESCQPQRCYRQPESAPSALTACRLR